MALDIESTKGGGLSITNRYGQFLMEKAGPISIGDAMFKVSRFDFTPIPDEREVLLKELEDNDANARYIPVPIPNSDRLTVLKRI